MVPPTKEHWPGSHSYSSTWRSYRKTIWIWSPAPCLVSLSALAPASYSEMATKGAVCSWICAPCCEVSASIIRHVHEADTGLPQIADWNQRKPAGIKYDQDCILILGNPRHPKQCQGHRIHEICGKNLSTRISRKPHAGCKNRVKFWVPLGILAKHWLNVTGVHTKTSVFHTT